MIYIYEENLDFYDALPNRSEFINKAIGAAKKRVGSDPNLDFVRAKLAAMDAAARNTPDEDQESGQ